ncbi:MAG: penicillin acylase family protein [Chloroflexi bacterium]|nr:penicillin acylase family protein [Chloroflexota bacterium]
MTSWIRNAGAAATAGAALAGLGTIVARRAVKGPLPDTTGTIRIPGLHGVVTIDRDAWGIPHIIASHPHDLYFGNGFVHAQDRLWQMEINRRVGSGTLSELFGELALGADRLMRHMGLRRVAEEEARRLDPDSKALYEAYCHGVNYYVSNFKRKWPLEFLIAKALPPPNLGWRPAPWELTDSLVFGKVMALSLCANWNSELVRMAVLERLGPTMAAALEPAYATDQPIVIPGGTVPRSLATGLVDAYAELEPFLAATGAGTSGFSNNWVVDGTRTASGKPLLANDPHLSVQIPSIWYEIELTGPGLDVVGASLPGTPGVVIGHNERIAWGVTAALLDVQDLVLEQLNPENKQQYLFEGTWRDGTLIREEIVVRGRRAPIIEEVLITHHGPVISPAIEGETRALALRWTALTPGELGTAVLGINRASNWDEFTEALKHWDVPSQNFVYADVDGNIGYYTPGAVPIRSKGNGALPVPGWTGEYEWTGFVPFEELPHAYNPASHQVVTANNRLVGSDYPYELGNEWLPGYRAQRIADMLGDRSDLTVEDFRRIQQDVYSIPGREAGALLSQLQGATEQERAALAKAREWDGYLTADSVGGCICLVFQHHLLRAVFGPILGDVTEKYLGTGSSVLAPRNGFFTRAVPFVYDLAKKRDDAWFDRMGVPDITWDSALRTALSNTIVFLSERLDRDVSNWRWGRLNRLGFNHVLGIRPPLDRLFNRGPVEMGGDDNTIAAAFLPLYSPFDKNGWTASYRQIVDLGKLENSLSMHTTGQSGHVGSVHYDDMIPAWREGRYHPMSLQVGDVRRELGGHLVLEPAPATDGRGS